MARKRLSIGLLASVALAGGLHLLVVIGVSALAGGPAAADVVTLTNGRSVRGKIVERRPSEIVVEVPYGRMTIPHAEITSIREESDFARLLGEGDELAAAGQYEKAIERYRLALALQPVAGAAEHAAARAKILLAYRNLARKRIAARDVAGAEEALTALLGLAPDDEEAKRSLGQLQALRGEVDSIVERAGLLFDIGAYAESASEYSRALALAPERDADLRPPLVEALNERGNAFFVQQRYPDAAVYFLRALRLAEASGGLARAGATPGTRPALDTAPAGAASQSALTESRLREVRKRWAYAVLVPIINEINANRLRTVDEWQAAAAEVGRVARVTPEAPHVHFVLGLCCEALSDPAGALAAYARVTGEPDPGPATPQRAEAARRRAHRVVTDDPVRIVVATKDERWLAVAGGDWQTLTTDHFVVLHRNAFVAEKVARAAEYWYDAILVHWTVPGTQRAWPRKCDIYLYPTREAFREATDQPDWAPAVTHIQVQEGQLVGHRLSTYQTVRLLNESVLPHELTHTIFPQLLGYPQEVPRWVNECAALLEEPDYKRYRFREATRTYLADGVALDFGRIRAVRENPKEEEAQRFYAQCHAIAEFLMSRGGRTAFLRFGRAMVTEGDEKALLATYGFKDIQEFDQAWRRFALAQR